MQDEKFQFLIHFMQKSLDGSIPLIERLLKLICIVLEKTICKALLHFLLHIKALPLAH